MNSRDENRKNKNYKKETTELYLPDLLIYCFLHWRSALVILCIGALCFGGGKALALKKGQANAIEAQDAQQTVHEKTQKSAEEAKVEDENTSRDSSLRDQEKAEQEKRIADNQKDFTRVLKDYREYAKDSIRMKIHAVNEVRASADYLLSLPFDEPANALTALYNAYQGAIDNGDYLQDLADEMQIEEKYLSELIAVQPSTLPASSFDDLSGTSESFSFVLPALDAREGKNPSGDQGEEEEKKVVFLISIAAIGADEDQAESLLSAVQKEIETRREGFSNTICPHDLTLVRTYRKTIADSDLLDDQRDILQNILDMEVQIKNYENTFKNELETASEEENAPAGEVTGALSEKEFLKAVFKYALAGGFLFFCIYGLVLSFAYAAAKAPRTRRQMEERYHFFMLGSMKDASDQLYRHHTALDRWLRHLGGLKEEIKDPDHLLEMVRTNLSVYYPEAKNILLLGTAGPALSGDIEETLRQNGDYDAIHSSVNLVEDIKARAYLKETEAVILCIQYGKTPFALIDKEVDLIERSNAEIAGVVML